VSERREWAQRAAEAVAGFTSTGSKAPEVMFGGFGVPTHCVSASGARVRTDDGGDLLDWTMALGAVGLGYAHVAVTNAAIDAAVLGAVGPLAPTLEVEVAERLKSAYPGAERVRFLKTGAEAVAAAVRIARVATGRNGVVYCGYHGWLDGPTWGEGVPPEVASLWRRAVFSDPGLLERDVRDVHPAAILLEPVIEAEPSREWLLAARRLADETGAVLIFDEIKTGFRLARGGAAERYGVRPDLAVLGKALANGYPLAALVGRADLMDRVRDTWISSTLATEFVSLAAADAVLDTWEHQDVGAHIRSIGTQAMEALRPLCAGIGVEVAGLPEMFFLRFGADGGERESRFLMECRGRGVLLKRGPYNFPSLAHTEADVATTARVVGEALEDLRE
jgi:glutamate-1-semialdehyde aminotransferase